MSKFFNEIVAPLLTQTDYGQGIESMVNNINANFQKVFTLPFLKGDDGDRLTTRFCPFWDSSDPNTAKLTEEGYKIFEAIFIDDKIKNGIEFENTKPGCTLGDLMKDLSGLFTESASSGETQFVQTYGPEGNPKILLYYLIDTESNNETLLGAAQLYYFFDPRIQGLSDFIGVNNTESVEGFVDYTCILSTKYVNGDSEYSYAYEKQSGWPTLYFDSSSKQFCWQINGQKTGVNAQGVNGRDGRGSKIWLCVVEPTVATEAGQTMSTNVDYSKGRYTKFEITDIWVPKLNVWLNINTTDGYTDALNALGESGMPSSGDIFIAYLYSTSEQSIEVPVYTISNGEWVKSDETEVFNKPPMSIYGTLFYDTQANDDKKYYVFSNISQNLYRTTDNTVLVDMLNHIGDYAGDNSSASNGIQDPMCITKGLFVPLRDKETDGDTHKFVHVLYNDLNDGSLNLKVDALANVVDVHESHIDVTVNKKKNLNVIYNTNLKRDLNVTGATTLNNGLIVNNNLITLNNTLNVTGEINHKLNLYSLINYKLSQDNSQNPLILSITADGQDTADSGLKINVDGAMNISGATTLSNTLNVNSATNLKGGLNVTGETTLNYNKDYNTNIFSNKNGRLYVGDSKKYSDISHGMAKSDITSDYLLHIGGDSSSIKNGLIPEGMYINRYSIQVKNWTDTSGLELYLNPDGGGVNIGTSTTDSSKNSDTNIYGKLTVEGATTLSSTLNVTGVTTLASTTASSLTVTGATTLSNTLNVTGVTTLASTTASSLTVTGATTLNSTLKVTGATTLMDTLTVGTTSSKKSTTLNGTLTVTGITSLTGGLTANNITSNTAEKNLNNYKTAGFYRCSLSAVAAKLENCPTSDAFALNIYETTGNNSGVVQELIEYMNGTTPNTYKRHLYNNSWGPWYRIPKSTRPSETSEWTAVGSTTSPVYMDSYGILLPAPNVTPVGSIVMWPSSTAPTGWRLCDGSAIDVDIVFEYSQCDVAMWPTVYIKAVNRDYATLLQHITAYNDAESVSQSKKMYLPDLRERFPLGKSSSYSLASTGGSSTHTLTLEQIPSHTHSYLVYDSNGSANSNVGSERSNLNTKKASLNTTYSGGGQAHNNMPPYLVVNYIIKYK